EEVCVLHIGELKFCFSPVGIFQIRFSKGGALKVSTNRVCLGQVRSFKIRAVDRFSIVPKILDVLPSVNITYIYLLQEIHSGINFLKMRSAQERIAHVGSKQARLRHKQMYPGPGIEPIDAAQASASKIESAEGVIVGHLAVDEHAGDQL